MKKIKIKFLRTALSAKKLFVRLLSKHYEVITEFEGTPDAVVFFPYYNDNEFQAYLNNNDIIKIIYSGESCEPNLYLCDYWIGTSTIFNTDRCLYAPLYIFQIEYFDIINNNIDLVDHPFERDFCSALISGDMTHRLHWFNTINNYKKVDSWGKQLNNVNCNIKERLSMAEYFSNSKVSNLPKYNLLRQYKFHLAFENYSNSAYVTEKICEAFIANTIPIYFGKTTITDDFNPNAFININEFQNENELIMYINYISHNEEAYIKMLNAAKVINKHNFIENLENFLFKIFENK